ncbi:MAG: hypothetical protein ACREQ5_00160 [Candidatus Dormibacteria bacterium]
MTGVNAGIAEPLVITVTEGEPLVVDFEADSVGRQRLHDVLVGWLGRRAGERRSGASDESSGRRAADSEEGGHLPDGLTEEETGRDES